MRTTTSLLGAAAIVAALAAAGCGGDGGGAATTTTDPDEARLAWAECMREHGVDVPDPEPGGGMRIHGTGSPDVMEQAQQACGDLQEAAAPEVSEERRNEMLDAAVAFAECMREHGVDMPDPQLGPGGGIVMRAQPGRGQADPSSPAFQEAQAACEELMPTPPGP